MRETIQGKCWNCGAGLGAHDYGRETNCLGCAKPTRVCRNCRWYDPAATDQCREPTAEPVMHKERPTYCEHFEPTDDPAQGAGDASDTLRQAAEDLFLF
ncbi:MAG: hypothetical protein G8D60_14015 [gamma proteobacterium symbiont of Phacoides pectinatus]